MYPLCPSSSTALHATVTPPALALHVSQPNRALEMALEQLQTYLQVFHMVQTVLVLHIVPVGQQLRVHYLPVSHQQYVHLLPLVQAMGHRVLPQCMPLRASCHLHCGHPNVKVFGAPFDPCLAARATVPSAVWEVLGQLPAIVPHPFTGADCLWGWLLGAGTVLPKT